MLTEPQAPQDTAPPESQSDKDLAMLRLFKAERDRRRRNLRSEYTPYGGVARLFSSQDYTQVLVSGPAGTGKSRGALEYLHQHCWRYADIRALLMRKTRASLTQTGLVTFEEKVLRSHPEHQKQVHFHGGDQEFRYPSRSIIAVAGLDKASKIMSSEWDLIYVMEATELTQNEWEMVSTRLRNWKLPYQQIIGDCNPDAPTHWLKRLSDAGTIYRLDSVHEDNPELFDQATGQIAPRGKDYLAKLDGLTGVRYLRLRKGLWVAAEGMVFDEWSEAVHRIDRFPIPTDWSIYIVVDFGFTNPFVAAWYAEDADGRLYRYREVYHTHRLVEDHAKVIKFCIEEDLKRGASKPRAILCDHDAEDRATLERHLGYQTEPADKNVSAGLQEVNARLRIQPDGKPRLYFLRDSLVERDLELGDQYLPCSTEEEIPTYVWDTSMNRKRGEEPVKKDDHGCFVAGTLISTACGLIPIEHVRPGDRVLTRRGFRRVLNCGMTQSSAAVVNLLTTAANLTGTPNHPVYVLGKGFVPMAELREHDKIVSTCISSNWSQPTRSNGSVSTASFTAAIHSPCVPATAITSAAASRMSRKATARCIGTSESSLTARFRRAGRFITKTRTRSTTASPIWKPWFHENTTTGMFRARYSGLPSFGRTLKSATPSLKALAVGISPKRAVHGTASMANVSWRLTKRDWPSYGVNVLNVARNSILAQRRNASAATTASQPTGVPKALTISMESVNSAALSPGSINTCRTVFAASHVRSVTPGSIPAAVYNLTIEGEHEYFANGLLVHNCDACRYICQHLGSGVGTLGYVEFLKRGEVAMELERQMKEQERREKLATVVTGEMRKPAVAAPEEKNGAPRCPHCQSAALQRVPFGQIRCTACGQQWPAAGVTLPARAPSGSRYDLVK
jgi:phage terminase large subunit